MQRRASAFTRPRALLMRTASLDRKPNCLQRSMRPSKEVIMMMRTLMGASARRVENGVTGLYVWANVALWEEVGALRVFEVPLAHYGFGDRRLRENKQWRTRRLL